MAAGPAIIYRTNTLFGGLTTMIQEHLSGVRIVRAYRQEQAELERFSELSADYLERNLRLVRALREEIGGTRTVASARHPSARARRDPTQV